VCYLVTHPERATAEPITAVVADRVRELRSSSGLSQAELAAKMVKLGIPWTRLTVLNVEKRSKEAREARGRGGAGGRDAVTAQELLALARVFDVPPVSLLVDITAATAVPFEGIERDGLAVMLWLVGKRPLTDPPGPAWDTAALPIRQACQLADLAERFGQVRQHRETVAALLPDGRDADRAAEDERLERRVLADLSRAVRALVRLGFPPPSLPDELVTRAVELGVELPGQEG